MREIKFRAYNKIEKFMIKIFDNTAQKTDWYLPNVNEKFEIMQFTGVKDKNGKDIYEGDIVNNGSLDGYVRWLQEHCSFVVFVPDSQRYFPIESNGQLKNTEVIGNIYENKELVGDDYNDVD